LINPIIVSFQLFGINFAIHWYGVLAAIGVLVGGLITENQIVRRGGKEGYLWDLLLWVVPAGIIGARLWYVLNDIVGGGQYFLVDPKRILYITEGGLHIYGSIALGLLVAYFYTRRHPFDIALLLDALAPGLLIGQAIGRFANYINQELYGQPTDLPWGVPISAAHRIGPYRDLTLYPEATTRFHPTFFYEIIANVLIAIVLLWLVNKYQDKLKPWTVFYAWMAAEGVKRFFIEFFRPDQPRIPGTGFSYSHVVAVLLAVIGTLLLLVRYEKIKLPFLSPGRNKYQFVKVKRGKK
jgi:phosphatidylglycerol:prolipoprotein diacylglycerol transferase